MLNEPPTSTQHRDAEACDRIHTHTCARKKYGMMIRDCDYIICAALFEYGSAEAEQSKTQKIHFYKLSRARCPLLQLCFGLLQS